MQLKNSVILLLKLVAEKSATTFGDLPVCWVKQSSDLFLTLEGTPLGNMGWINCGLFALLISWWGLLKLCLLHSPKVIFFIL